MNQRTLIQKLETIVVVTVVAMLVWLYAEGASTKDRSREPVSVRFVAPDGRERDFAVSPDQAVSASVSFKGSSGQVQNFLDLVRDPIELTVEPPDAGQSARTLVLADALVRNDEFAKLGLGNIVVEPATWEVVMRPLVTVTLPVRVEIGDLPLDPATTPVATPDSVEITAPADVLDDLGDAVVVARLDRGALAGLSEDPATGGREKVARNIALEFPATIDRRSPWTRLSNQVVRVNYTLADPDATVTVERVPLYVNLPVGTQLVYRVTPNDGQKFLFDVELRGPKGLIDRIAAGDPAYPVTAEIRIKDLSGIESITDEQPVIVPPAGVTVVGSPPRVGLRVERRVAGP